MKNHNIRERGNRKKIDDQIFPPNQYFKNIHDHRISLYKTSSRLGSQISTSTPQYKRYRDLNVDLFLSHDHAIQKSLGVPFLVQGGIDVLVLSHIFATFKNHLSPTSDTCQPQSFASPLSWREKRHESKSVRVNLEYLHCMTNANRWNFSE